MLTKRIKEAIDIFLDAINNGTLVKGDPCGCAVGNLLAGAQGITLTKEPYLKGVKIKPDYNGDWYDMGCRLLKLMAEKTEFTHQQLLKIERTFENNTSITHTVYNEYTKEEIRADQIKGLEAVIELMLTFDEQKENIKEIFTNKANLIPVI